MQSSGILRRAAPVKTDVPKEGIASTIIMVTKIGELRNNVNNLSRLGDSCHPDDEGKIFIGNVGFYKSHMA
jgi:hypothetical protein